jgi:hypothetical protein
MKTSYGVVAAMSISVQKQAVISDVIVNSVLPEVFAILSTYAGYAHEAVLVRLSD